MPEACRLVLDIEQNFAITESAPLFAVGQRALDIDVPHSRHHHLGIAVIVVVTYGYSPDFIADRWRMDADRSRAGKALVYCISVD